MLYRIDELSVSVMVTERNMGRVASKRNFGRTAVHVIAFHLLFCKKDATSEMVSTLCIDFDIISTKYLSENKFVTDI